MPDATPIMMSAVTGAPMVASNQSPATIAYSVAKQQHPLYAEKCEIWTELDLLYKGGYYVERNSQKFLPKLDTETATRYSERLQSAAYLNYLGQIVDHFVSAVFSHTLDISEAADAADPTTPGGKSDPDFWSKFSADADRKGTPFSDVMKSVLRLTLLKQRCYIGCDLPRGLPVAQNALDEQKLGATRGYVYEIPVEQIINWENDDSGQLAWCVINRSETKQATPFDRRGTITETFKIWTRPGGTVRWDLFSIEYPPDKQPKPDDPVIWVDGDVVSFAQIPVLVFEISDAFWVGNKVGPGNKEHYQRRSMLVSAEHRNLCAIAVYQAGAEVPAQGGAISMNSEDPDRGEGFTARATAKGYVVTGAQDKIYYAEPTGSAYQVVDQQIKALKDELFRVVHQMAAAIDNNRMSLGRSGESKKQDKFAESIVLGEFGRIVKAFAKRIYDTIAAVRGELVVWVANGLDGYDTEDRDVLIAEAAQMPMIAIPSRTFQVEYKCSVANKLMPDLNSQTKAVIRQEIGDGVDAEQEMQQVVADARKDALQNGASDDGDGDKGRATDDDGERAAA